MKNQGQGQGCFQEINKETQQNVKKKKNPESTTVEKKRKTTNGKRLMCFNT